MHQTGSVNRLQALQELRNGFLRNLELDRGVPTNHILLVQQRLGQPGGVIRLRQVLRQRAITLILPNQPQPFLGQDVARARRQPVVPRHPKRPRVLGARPFRVPRHPIIHPRLNLLQLRRAFNRKLRSLHHHGVSLAQPARAVRRHSSFVHNPERPFPNLSLHREIIPRKLLSICDDFPPAASEPSTVRRRNRRNRRRRLARISRASTRASSTHHHRRRCRRQRHRTHRALHRRFPFLFTSPSPSLSSSVQRRYRRRRRRLKSSLAPRWRSNLWARTPARSRALAMQRHEARARGVSIQPTTTPTSSSMLDAREP